MKRRSIVVGTAKAALLLVSLTFSLVVGEIVLRALGYQAIYEVYSKPSILWQYDELLGWAHEPNTETPYIGPRPWPIEFENDISINSDGLRGPEIEPLPPGGLRVLVLGDSMVAGFEVAHEETFIVGASELLTEALDTPVQVVNGGVRGYGTDQSFLYYRDRGRLLNPHVVLMWLSVNDLVNDVTIHRMRRIYGKAAFVPDDVDGLRLIGAPVPDYPVCSEYRVSAEREIVRLDSVTGRVLCRVQMALFDRSALFSFLTQLVPWDQWGDLLRRLYYVGMPQSKGKPPVPASGTEAEEKTVVTDRILRALAREVETRGAHLVFVSTPQMLGRFEESGVRLDGYEVIALDAVDASDPREIRFEHDSHLNVKGHRIVAEALRDALLPLLVSLRDGAP